jgi:hypothetical protein
MSLCVEMVVDEAECARREEICGRVKVTGCFGTKVQGRGGEAMSGDVGEGRGENVRFYVVEWAWGDRVIVGVVVCSALALRLSYGATGAWTEP